jgi:phage terminase large subunit
MSFIRTTAINKLKKLPKFIKGVQGGTSAGKTFGIIPIEIDIAAKNAGTETSIVSESIPHLKRGAMKDFIKIMKWTNRWNANRWNATDFKYTFANGSYIEFFSADSDSKLRGARRDRLYINECNNVSFAAFTELAMRTKESIFLDWNPSNEFWFHQELMTESNVDYIILTYLDNEGAPQSAIDFILRAKEKALTSAYWANWYKVYGLGELGSLEGVIFKDWKQIDKLPSEAKLLGYGLDFGYTSDPTACVGLYKWNEGYILDEMVYRTGMLNRDIFNHCRDMAGVYVADSAEPKSIAELQGYGMQVLPATKGKDSVIHGIQLLQGVELYVTSQSTNLIKELRNYVWDKDRHGNTIANVPIDNYNHLIDAARYVAQRYISKSHGLYSFG